MKNLRVFFLLKQVWMTDSTEIKLGLSGFNLTSPDFK